MIGVIVLNWNNRADTLECIRSVQQSEGCAYTLYVVDNGSSDNSAAALREVAGIRFLPLPQNLGFAGGCNKALREALRDGMRYLFLLNNDAVVNKHTLRLLRDAAAAHPEAGALAPSIYFYDNPSVIWYGGGVWTEKTASFCHRDKNLDASEIPQRSIEPTDYTSGCAFFTGASTVEKTGLLDERFFLNWEEIDWCSRMQKQGLSCLFVPEAKAWHKVSRTFTLIDGKRGPTWHYYYYRNWLLWMEKTFPWNRRLHIAKNTVWPRIKSLIRECKNPENRPLALASLRGIRDYGLRRFGKR